MVKGRDTKLRQLLPAGQVPPEPLAGDYEQLPAAAAVGVPGNGPQPHQAAVISWLQRNPWEVQTRHAKEVLLKVLPKVLQPATAHWAVEVYFAPNLAHWKQHVQALCWWSTVSVLPRDSPLLPARWQQKACTCCCALTLAAPWGSCRSSTEQPRMQWSFVSCIAT
jgi:hypothetical protein